MRECHKLILEVTETLTICSPGQCDYISIGYAYHHTHDYHKSAYFFELALRYQFFLDSLPKVSLLVDLHQAYNSTESEVQCEDTKEEIMNLFPSLMTVDSSVIYYYSVDVFRVAQFYAAHDMLEEANALADRLFQVMIEFGRLPEPKVVFKSRPIPDMMSLRLLFFNELFIVNELLNDRLQEVQDVMELANSGVFYVELTVNFDDEMFYIERTVDITNKQKITGRVTGTLHGVCSNLVQSERLQCLVDQVVGYVTWLYAH